MQLFSSVAKVFALAATSLDFSFVPITVESPISKGWFKRHIYRECNQLPVCVDDFLFHYFKRDQAKVRLGCISVLGAQSDKHLVTRREQVVGEVDLGRAQAIENIVFHVLGTGYAKDLPLNPYPARNIKVWYSRVKAICGLVAE